MAQMKVGDLKKRDETDNYWRFLLTSPKSRIAGSVEWLVMMLRMTLVGTLVAALLGCKGTEERPYVLRTRVENKGSATELMLHVRARPPYKWNDKYPFKLRIASSNGAEPVATEFNRTHVELDGDEKGARVKIPLKGAPKAEWRIEGRAAFSVCTPKACRIFTDVPVTWGPTSGD